MKRTCPECSKIYDAEPARLKHGRQTTCSRECSYKRRSHIVSQKLRKNYYCFCGQPRLAGRRYCSEYCKISRRLPNKNKGTHKIEPHQYICFYCGKSIESWRKRTKNREFCDRGCYESQKSLDMTGSKNPMYGKSPTSRPKDWKQGWYTIGGQRIFVRSSWELVVAQWLERKGKDWKYEYQRFKLSNGKTYVPDFFILKDGKIDLIIEVKGWLKPKDRQKIKLFRREYDFPLQVWTRKKLKYLNLLDANSYGKV